MRGMMSGRLMVAMLAAAALALVVLVPCTEGAMQENIYASGCSGDEVILQCPQDHRIAIKRLFYGVKRAWDCQQEQRNAECCHAAHTDCLINEDSKYPTLNTHCSGYQRCKFQVHQIPASVHCPGAAHTDYMTVIYDCVPEIDIATFCSDDEKRGKTLFLSNAEYPSSVGQEKAECSCLVRTRGGSEGLNIHSIDVLLAWAQHGQRSCSKQLGIKDDKGYRWNIQCGHLGYYGFRTIYTRPVHNVTLTLTSSAAKGSAFVWLQTKATDDEEDVEIICGEPLRQILVRSKQEVESRHRNDDSSSNHSATTTDRGRTRNSTYPHGAHIESLSKSLAAIIGGIVGAGFILISIVIIALAFHCRRVQLARLKRRQTLNLYPAVTNGDVATTLSSYCRYNDYDDDHYSSINRSPLKMSSLTESETANHHHVRPNGFVTLATAEAHAAKVRVSEYDNDDDYNASLLSPHSPPSSARDPLLGDYGNGGYVTLSATMPPPSHRANGQVYEADVRDAGHRTLPENYRSGHRYRVGGPTSPLGKRSKSVTFSQPVAMVTPLPSGSEESMEGQEAEEGKEQEEVSTSSLEEGSYDNLNKISIPDSPLSPSQVHTMPVQRPAVGMEQGQGYPERYPGYPDNSTSLPRSMSTFSSTHDPALKEMDDFPLPPPPSSPTPPPPSPPPVHVVMNGDTYAVVHKKPVPLPVVLGQKQNAQVYETGV